MVSVGTFDGIHKGHQAIIRRMTDIARENKLVSVIVTFDPHPRYVLKKDAGKLKLLSTTGEKIEKLAAAGIDYALIINFTEDFAKIPYEDFVKSCLIEDLCAKHIVAGFDHRFGENRSGDHDKLAGLKLKYGFSVTEIKALNDDGSAISSTKIRKLIENREVDQANILLNYTYSLSGKVVMGNKTGRKLGFPTANLLVADPNKLIPGTGAYIVSVEIDGEHYFGMCNIGFKPTFEKQPLTIETYILNFNKDIYGKNMSVGFISFLRNEKKFDSIDLLKAQLEEDNKCVLKKINEQ